VTLRAFVAAFPPSADRAAIRERVEPLVATLPQLRPVAPESYHVTLRFLGTIVGDDIDPVRAALTPVAARSAAIRCRSVGLHALPSARRARVIAFELDSDGLLDALGEDVHRALTTRFGRADRPFLPHLTVLRGRGARIDLPRVDNVELSLGSIGLYRSDTQPEGAQYSALFELTLGG
jgi:2'-5' RNA ligase